MIYVLIALALFGALTLALSSQNEQADGQDLSDEQAEFYATELIEYAASTKNIIDQMIATGTDIGELDFINPASAGFDTPPHIHKVYHPQGGGLNYQETFNEAIHAELSAGWYIEEDQNIEWTLTTQADRILTAAYIPRTVCSAINRKITGSIDVPLFTVQGINDYFVDGAGTDLDVTSVACPDCEGYPSLCVGNFNDTAYGFYNIIAAQ